MSCGAEEGRRWRDRSLEEDDRARHHARTRGAGRAAHPAPPRRLAPRPRAGARRPARLLRRRPGRRHAVGQAQQRHRERPGGVPARLGRVDAVARPGDAVRRRAGHPGARRLGAPGRPDRRRPGGGGRGRRAPHRGRGRRRTGVAADPERGRPGRPGRRAAARRQHRLRDAARHRRGRHRRGRGRRPAELRHRPGRPVRRLRRGLRGHRRPAAVHHGRRHPGHPAAHLPQPGLPPRAGVGRARARARAGRRLPRRRGRRPHGRRPEPGHPVGPRARGEHRLRPAAHQPLQGGAAPRGLLDGRDARRLEGRVPADPRLRRDRRARPAVPAAVGPQQQQVARPGRRDRHRLRRPRHDGLPAGAAHGARPLLVLPLRPAPRRRRDVREGHLGPGRRPRRPPSARRLGHDGARPDVRGPVHHPARGRRPDDRRAVHDRGRLRRRPGGPRPPLPGRHRRAGQRHRPARTRRTSSSTSSRASTASRAPR